MRALCAALLLAAIPLPAQDAAAAAPEPTLAQVQRVYVLPMALGVDQFVAQRLTSERVFQVVADPKLADAIFTDTLGTLFEKRLDVLYPPPKPPQPAEETASEKDKTDGSGSNKETAKEEEDKAAPVRLNAGARSKGNVFLVDRRTRKVLWAVYQRPKSGAADELAKTSQRIVADLRKALNPETSQ